MAGQSRVIIHLLLFVSAMLAQSPPSAAPPQFAEYKAQPAFSGTPAAPQTNMNNARRFRTVLRAGAAKGPNFDEHYTLVQWGCGAGCAQFSIVDAKTGSVYDPPFQSVSFGSTEQGFVEDSGIRYKLDSSLLVISGCPDGKECAIGYYAGTARR